MAHRMGEDRAFRLRRPRPDRTSRRRLFLLARRGSGAPRSPRRGSPPRSRPATARRSGLRSAHGWWQAPPRSRPRRGAARAGGHGSSGCRARRHRSSRPSSAAISAPSSIFGSWVSAATAVNSSSPTRADRIVRPLGEERHVGKSLRRREGRARIDDRDVEAGDLRHRRQRLADMDGADHDQPRRRQLDGEEQALAADLDHARDTRTEARRELVAERIVGVAVGLDHQPRLAGRGVGDEDRAAVPPAPR